MTETLVASLLVTVIALAIASFEIVSWLSRRRWRNHEQYPFLVGEFGFEAVADRFLLDRRIQRYVGNHRARSVAIETGAGPHGAYARVDVSFDRDVALGLRISSEHEDGMMTRVMRLREIEVGIEQFDSQFILLSRDEDRLKELLDRNVRRMLSGLNEKVLDLRLNDGGVHFQVFGPVDAETFKELLDAGSQLASQVYQRAEQMRERREALATDAFTPVTGSMPTLDVKDVR